MTLWLKTTLRKDFSVWQSLQVKSLKVPWWGSRWQDLHERCLTGANLRRSLWHLRQGVVAWAPLSGKSVSLLWLKSGFALSTLKPKTL